MATTPTQCLGCKPTINGHTYDLSLLQGVDLHTVGPETGNFYQLSLCGQVPKVSCSKADVQTGMAAETGEGVCNILSVYDGDQCYWSEWLVDDEFQGIILRTSDGSSAGCKTPATKRDLSIFFQCDQTQTIPDENWSADKIAGCSYQMELNTCLACKEGCVEPQPWVPAPAPEPAGGLGGGWIFLIVVLSLAFVGGGGYVFWRWWQQKKSRSENWK